MVTSSYCIACSVNAIRQDRHRAAVIWLVAGLDHRPRLPGGQGAGNRWNLAHGINGESGIFFTVYYYLTFNHLVHTWGILGILWVLARLLFHGYTADDHTSASEALASYWHATDIIWLVIFPSSTCSPEHARQGSLRPDYRRLAGPGGLTLASLGLSEWFRDLAWLPLVVAGIMWLKGIVAIARCFIEIAIAHPFIARVVKVFIAIAPAALVITAFFGATVARWATL